jgi:hypothetical protein
MENKPAKCKADRRPSRNTRLLSDESLREIADALHASPAIVLSGNIVGGDHPTGVMLSLAYEGDDVAACGKDILFWIRWHMAHGNGGGLRAPRIIINPASELPEMVRLELDFGSVDRGWHDGLDDAGALVDHACDD